MDNNIVTVRKKSTNKKNKQGNKNDDAYLDEDK